MFYSLVEESKLAFVGDTFEIPMYWHPSCLPICFTSVAYRSARQWSSEGVALFSVFCSCMWPRDSEVTWSQEIFDN